MLINKLQRHTQFFYTTWKVYLFKSTWKYSSYNLDAVHVFLTKKFVLFLLRLLSATRWKMQNSIA